MLLPQSVVADLLLAAALLLASQFIFFLLAKKVGVAGWPSRTVVPVFFFVGLALWFPLSPLFIANDGEYYLSWGYSLSDAWTNSGSPLEERLWPGKGVWPLIIAIFHFLFGPVAASLIAFNSIVCGFSIVALQKAVLLISGKKSTLTIVVLVLSSPPLVMFGPSLLRESLFWLGVSLGVLSVIYFGRQEVGRGVWIFVTGSLFLLLFRSDAGVVIVFGLLAVIIIQVGLFTGTRTLRRKLFTGLALTALVTLSPFAFDLMQPGASDSERVRNGQQDLNAPAVSTAFGGAEEASDVGEEASDVGEEASDVGERCNVSATGSLGLVTTLLCYSALHFPQAMFGPFPSEFGPEPIWIIASLSTIHFLVLLVPSVVYLVSLPGRGWISSGVTAVAGLSFVMISAIASNYGLLIRFRVMTEILLFPLSVAGMALMIPGRCLTQRRPGRCLVSAAQRVAAKALRKGR